MRQIKLKSLKPCDIAIGACLFCLLGLIVSAYLWPIVTPPTKVVPTVAAPGAPIQADPQETPQEPQEEPDILQGVQITPDSLTPTPPAQALPASPLSSPGVIEIPVEVIVKPKPVPTKPVSTYPPCSNNTCRPRRGWFR